jgi:hypothetical protein
MKFNRTKRSAIVGLCSLLTAFALISCQPDEFDNGNGLNTSEDVDASFTISPVEGKNNTYLMTPNGSYITSFWNLDDGAGFNAGSATREVFYPDAGTYNIHHKVIGIGGLSATTQQQLIVESSDPLAGNIVRGGTFADDNDIAKWTVLNIGNPGTEWTFGDGKAKVNGGDWNQQAIYQSVDVIEGVSYHIDLLVSSTSGVEDTWFEVYASSKTPVDGADYSGDGAVAKFSTWGECAKEPFNGKLSVVGCDFDGEQGAFTAQATETIYLVIKCGGADLKDGVFIDNVEMRATN